MLGSQDILSIGDYVARISYNQLKLKVQVILVIHGKPDSVGRSWHLTAEPHIFI